MDESEVDVYKLNFSDKEQKLRISIINNEQISMIVSNPIDNQNYKAVISLPQLKQSCNEVFLSTETIKEAINILKNTIESGNITLDENKNNDIIELKYIISTDLGDIGLCIGLSLEEENIAKSDVVEELPPTFDYQGNKETEEKYANITKDTTEYIKPIFKPDIKPPVVELEYIEPILQVHYPDGSTESTALPPRIQEASGNMSNITEEQFKTIRDYFVKMNKNITFHRSNSAAKDMNIHSSKTIEFLDNDDNEGKKIYNNVVRPAMTRTDFIDNSEKVNHNFNHTDVFSNNFNDKIYANYSSMTMPHRTIEMNNRKNIPHSRFTRNNKMIERRPRMINSKTNNINGRPKNNPRAISLPHQDFYDNNNNNKSKEQNTYQTIYANNTYQQNNIYENNKKRYPYDRNTHNIRRYNQSLNINSKSPNDKSPSQNKIERIKSQKSQIEDRLTLIQLQQQKVQKVQQQLAQIQQRQKEFQQKKIIFQSQNPNQTQNKTLPQSPLKNKQTIKTEILREQIHISPKQNLIEQTQENTNKQQKKKEQFEHKSSHEVKFMKTDIISEIPLKSKKSNPSPLKTSPSLQSIINKTITQEQIQLAQMASIQNEYNPNCSSLEAFTLPNQEDEIQENEEKIENAEIIKNEEIEEISNLKEEEQLAGKEKYEEEKNENVEKKEEIQKNEEMGVNEENEENDEFGVNEEIEGNEEIQENPQNEILDIEALFMNEEGRVIFRNGLLRGIIHKYSEIDDVVSKIQDLLLKGVKFNLVYKAFDVGDRASTFHEKCDKLKMSLVLVETDKDIRFGGFTTESWEGNCLRKNDNNAFVFSLDTKKIFDIIPNEPAVGCYPKFGPVFFGCQIRIYDNFFKTGGTTCLKGLNYKTSMDYELNNGEQTFLIKDIEIYGIETIEID